MESVLIQIKLCNLLNMLVHDFIPQGLCPRINLTDSVKDTQLKHLISPFCQIAIYKVLPIIIKIRVFLRCIYIICLDIPSDEWVIKHKDKEKTHQKVFMTFFNYIFILRIENIEYSLINIQIISFHDLLIIQLVHFKELINKLIFTFGNLRFLLL